jgi:hypothetical protein
MPTYRLLTETGDDLGSFRAGTPTWVRGDRIHRGRETLEVVSLTMAEDGDKVDGYLVVRTVAEPSTAA